MQIARSEVVNPVATAEQSMPRLARYAAVTKVPDFRIKWIARQCQLGLHSSCIELCAEPINALDQFRRYVERRHNESVPDVRDAAWLLQSEQPWHIYDLFHSARLDFRCLIVVLSYPIVVVRRPANPLCVSSPNSGYNELSDAESLIRGDDFDDYQ